MQTPRAYWTQWTDHLRRLGMTGLAAWLLEAGGPFTLLGAQALYFGQPFLGGEQARALAQMLEDDEQAMAFAAFLREEMAS